MFFWLFVFCLFVCLFVCFWPDEMRSDMDCEAPWLHFLFESLWSTSALLSWADTSGKLGLAAEAVRFSSPCLPPGQRRTRMGGSRDLQGPTASALVSHVEACVKQNTSNGRCWKRTLALNHKDG